ncbi:MAG: hypothetical protein AB1Z38_07380 [Desulfotignum sp.]
MEQALPIEELAQKRLDALIYSYSLLVKNLMKQGVALETVKKASDETWAMLGHNTAQQLKPMFGEKVTIENLKQSGMMATGVHGMEMTEKIQGDTIRSEYTKCPWQEANMALDIPEDWRICQSGHAAFTEAMYKGLIPSAAYKLTNTMPAGDNICVGTTTI